MSDSDDFDEHGNGECWNCGGVGRVNDCIDGCCVDQDDPWCSYCSTRCDICNPKRSVGRAALALDKGEAK